MGSTWELGHVICVKVHVRARHEVPPSPDSSYMLGELVSSSSRNPPGTRG
jgi:hypothetical protein